MRRTSLSRGDLDFLLEANALTGEEATSVSQQLLTDAHLRASLVDNESVFSRALHDDEIMLKISPPLFFEILLCKARSDLQQISYTMEQASGLSVPVFDAEEVVVILEDEAVLAYLAEMLASFTRTRSRWINVRGKGRVWRRVRYSDLDIWSLMRLAEEVEPTRRLAVYQRIADLCLFVLGMFPDHAEQEYRYPHTGELRRRVDGRGGISPEEYETRGRQFYRLAAEQRLARSKDLSDVFWTLHEGFQQVLKPLNFISLHYLQFAGWRALQD